MVHGRLQKECQTFEHLPLFFSKAGQDLAPCRTRDSFVSYVCKLLVECGLSKSVSPVGVQTCLVALPVGSGARAIDGYLLIWVGPMPLRVRDIADRLKLLLAQRSFGGLTVVTTTVVVRWQ